MRAPIVLAAAGLALAGCRQDPVGSEKYRNGYLWAELQIEHRADDTVVARAFLRLEGEDGESVVPSGDDRMECNGVILVDCCEVVPMAPDDRYVFDFVRSDGTVSSEVRAPARPEIIGTDPVSGVVHDGDSLGVAWDPGQPGERVRVSLSGECIDYLSESVEPDQGSYTFPAPVEGDPARPGDCALTLSVTRYDSGPVSPEFQGGTGQGSRGDELELEFVDTP